MYTQTIMNAVAANANLTSAEFVYEYPDGENGCKQVCDGKVLSFEVIASGIDAATAVVKLMHSGTSGGTFLDVTDATVTLTSATTFTIAPICFISKKYYKIDYAKGANTTGTITVKITAG